MTSGQTRDIKFFLLTISFGLEVRTINRSRARAPNSTATPSFVRRRSFTSKLKGPNDKPPSVRLITVAMGPTASVHLAVQEIRTFPANHKERGDGAFPRLER